MDTHSWKITSVGRIVRKTCRFRQKHPEENSRKGFTDRNRTPHDPERSRSHSQQQTLNICGKRHITYINSTDTFKSLQWTKLINIAPPWTNRRQHHCESPRTQAGQSKTVLLDKLQQSIWNILKTEYLSFLRERQEANKRKTSQTTATEGDIVPVYDDTPRSTWTLWRVEELYKGNNEQERSARLRIQERDITRAFYKLYPLELTATEESKPDEPAEDLQEDNIPVVEQAEDKSDSSLSGDCRPRSKALTRSWTTVDH